MAWKSVENQALTPKQTVKDTPVIVTPKLLLASAASLVVLIMVGYIWFQVRNLTAPPELVISNPSQSTKVAIEQIEISGKTDPGATVAINDQVINQDKEGNFKETIALRSGVNTIQIVATNHFNKQKSQTITVLRTGEGERTI
jgi:hypothetical protein